MNIVKNVFQGILVFLMLALFIRGMLFVFKDQNVSQPTSGNHIAVVNFQGEIEDSSPLINEIKKLEKNDNIKGYILRVNSPGGAVTPSQEIYEYLLTVKKPLYVSMSSTVASGGYMISLPANRIYAMESTITGSIGVIMQISNMKELYEKIGIDVITIKSGKFKDTGNPFRDFTEEDEKILDAVIMDLYNQFVTYVSTRRNIPMDEAINLADGRIYTGLMAKDAGLIDGIGTWEDVFVEMKQNLNMPDLEYFFVEIPRKSKMEKFLSKLDFGFAAKSSSGFYYLMSL